MTEAVSPPVSDDWTPFPDVDCAKFELTKDVNQAQLHDELEKKLGTTIQLSGSRDPGTGLGYIWLVPSTVDSAVVTQVMDDHVPDAMWGVPQSTIDYIALVQRVMTTPDAELSDDDVKTAIRGLLVRMQNSGG